MEQLIHPTALIADGAKLGAGVKVGPYCIVGPNVELGDNVELFNHVSLNGHTTIGADSKLYPFVSMGYPPQDFKHKGGPVSIEIGQRCIFREGVNIHPGTDCGNPVTRVGDDCYFMVGAHLAHEAQMGHHVVVSNGVQIGGNVKIGNHVVLGGLCAIHQHTRIGDHAFVGGLAAVTTDVIPYGFVVGNPARLAGLNIVGLKRRGFSRQTIHNMRAAYRLLFAPEGTFSERLSDTEEGYRDEKFVVEIVDFIKSQADRAICMPHMGR